jgi:hypothetical protein
MKKKTSTNRPASHQASEVGFAIRDVNSSGYYDCNGIGDTSLAGTPLTCEIFTTRAEAEETIESDDMLEAEECEIVSISRAAAAVVSVVEGEERR